MHQLAAICCRAVGPHDHDLGKRMAAGKQPNNIGDRVRQFQELYLKVRESRFLHVDVVGLGVAVGSSLLHNLLFSMLGLNTWQAFPGNVLAMATGDFVGSLLAVVIVFLILRIYRRQAA